MRSLFRDLVVCMIAVLMLTSMFWYYEAGGIMELVTHDDIHTINGVNDRYNRSTWHECFRSEDRYNRSIWMKPMEDILRKVIIDKEVKLYVSSTTERRPRFFNQYLCNFPMQSIICNARHYYFSPSIYIPRNIDIGTNSTHAQYFGVAHQFIDMINVMQSIFEINKYAIMRNELKWIFVFEDDVSFCPDTPQYMLNAMNLSTSKDINVLHLSRGGHGLMIKPAFIPQFVELLKEAKLWKEQRKNEQVLWREKVGYDVILTRMFIEKKNHFGIYYSRFNMMHHPLKSTNPEAALHKHGNVNHMTCGQIGQRFMAEELMYINPYNMEITFENLNS